MRFVVCLTMCHFVLVFFCPFSIAITSLGEERVNLSAFRTFVRFVLVWICRFPLPLGVWEGLRFLIVALPGLFSYLFLQYLFNFIYFIFCLLKRLLKGNKYFEGIKLILKNRRVDTKVFLFLSLFISLLKYLFIYLFFISCI